MALKGRIKRRVQTVSSKIRSRRNKTSSGAQLGDDIGNQMARGPVDRKKKVTGGSIRARLSSGGAIGKEKGKRPTTGPETIEREPPEPTLSEEQKKYMKEVLLRYAADKKTPKGKGEESPAIRKIKTKRRDQDLDPNRKRRRGKRYDPHKRIKDKSAAKKAKREPGGYATGGRVAKSSGGTVSSRLSKAGPIAKPN